MESSAPFCLPPLPLSIPPARSLPEGSCDTHFHVFEPGAWLSPARSYTPHVRTIDDWMTLADAFGIARGVLVQPSVYGFDNGVLLNALQAHPGRLRGVVVVEPMISPRELSRLDALGVRGVRINLRNPGGLGWEAAKQLDDRIAPLGWCLDFQVGPERLDDLAEAAAGLRSPVVVDHFGFVQFDGQLEERAADSLMRFLARERTLVKLTAPYRLGKGASAERLARLIGRLANAHPDRLLWGTDWPHTELWTVVPNDAVLVEQMIEALGGDANRSLAMVETARRLFWAR